MEGEHRANTPEHQKNCDERALPSGMVVERKENDGNERAGDENDDAKIVELIAHLAHGMRVRLYTVEYRRHHHTECSSGGKLEKIDLLPNPETIGVLGQVVLKIVRHGTKSNASGYKMGIDVDGLVVKVPK